MSDRPGLTYGVWPSAEPWTGRLKKLDSESIKSQEIIYNQDFNIAQLERRIARMQGEVWLIPITHYWLTMVTHNNDSFQVNNEEKTALEERLAEAGFQIEAFWLALRGLLWLADESEIWIWNPNKLNGTLEEKHKTKKILDEQQRKLQVNLRRCQVEMEKCTREHDALNSKIEELELYDDSSQRELKRKGPTHFGLIRRFTF